MKRCPDKFLWPLARMEISEELVNDFIEKEYDERWFFVKWFSRPLSYKKASITLFKVKHGIR